MIKTNILTNPSWKQLSMTFIIYRYNSFLSRQQTFSDNNLNCMFKDLDRIYPLWALYPFHSEYIDLLTTTWHAERKPEAEAEEFPPYTKFNLSHNSIPFCIRVESIQFENWKVEQVSIESSSKCMSIWIYICMYVLYMLYGYGETCNSSLLFGWKMFVQCSRANKKFNKISGTERNTE